MKTYQSHFSRKDGVMYMYAVCIYNAQLAQNQQEKYMYSKIVSVCYFNVNYIVYLYFTTEQNVRIQFVFRSYENLFFLINLGLLAIVVQTHQSHTAYNSAPSTLTLVPFPSVRRTNGNSKYWLDTAKQTKFSRCSFHIKFVAGLPTLDFACIMTQIKLHTTHM